MRKFGNPCFFLPVIDSSNLEAWRLIKEKRIAEGGIVHAAFQTHGKGQGKSRWESTEGDNLTFSLVLQPVFLAPARQFLLNMAIALAVREAAVHMSKNRNILLKWPNDIYYQEYKLGGILIENSICGNSMTYTVAGIGLNINQEKFLSDAPNPISIRQISGNSHDVKDALQTLCHSLYDWYQLLKEGRDKLLYKAYYSSLLGYEQQKTFIAGEHIFSAVIKGVDADGKLLLQSENGQIQAWGFKEITYVFQASKRS